MTSNRATFWCDTNRLPSNTPLLQSSTGNLPHDITPFAFEDALKDTTLGGSDLHFDWYQLFKAKTWDFVLGGEAAVKLGNVVRLMIDAKREYDAEIGR